MRRKGEAVNRIIIMGSPKSNGRSAHLAEMLFEACIDECPEDELFLVPVSELDIAPCIGCEACRAKASAPDEPASEETVEGAAAEGERPDDETPDYPHCPRFDDDMQDVYPLLPEADELIVVSPVYFSGAPSSLKALLDRMQPHFWADSRKAPKRPATLHVVGEGGDPHGYDALVSEVRSSLACVGFRLERVLDWVGKIAADGEIEDEATEVPLVAKQSLGSVADAPEPKNRESKDRPKLDLSAGSRGKGARSAAKGDGSKAGRKELSESAKQAPANRKGGSGGGNRNGGKGHGQSGKSGGGGRGDAGRGKGRRRG